MKIKFVSILFILFIFSLSSQASAKSPCGSVLCLSGLMEGDNFEGCKKHIKDYFSIRKFKHGKWRVGKTVSKRYKYLKQCPEADKPKIVAINTMFGHIYDM